MYELVGIATGFQFVLDRPTLPVADPWDSMPTVHAWSVLRKNGMPEKGYSFPGSNTEKHFRINVDAAGVNLAKLRLPAFEWSSVDQNGLHPGFIGNFRYSKRILLIRDGLKRVTNDGLLHVLTLAHLQAVSTTLADSVVRPLAFTELPTLISGGSITSTDKIKEVLEALAIEINTIHEEQGAALG